MSRRAYFRFYPREFLQAVKRYSDDMAMAYLRLLCEQFADADANALPTHMQELMLITENRITEAQLQKILDKHFTLTNEGYINDKMAAQITQMIEKSNKAKESANKRWDANADANAMRTHSGRNATKYQVPNTNTKEEEGAKAPTRKKFIKPTIEEIKEYCELKNYTLNSETFLNHYESNGWRVGKNPMKSWKAALTNWQTRENDYGKNKPNAGSENLQERTLRKNKEWLEQQQRAGN